MSARIRSFATIKGTIWFGRNIKAEMLYSVRLSLDTVTTAFWDMRYQHLNTAGELMTGVCISTPEILPDGGIRLHEKWRWTSGDLSEGSSVIEEIIDRTQL